MKPSTLYEYLQIYDGLRGITKRWTPHQRRMLMEASQRYQGLFYERDGEELKSALLCYTTDNPAVKDGKNVMANEGHFLYVAVAWSKGGWTNLLRLVSEALVAFEDTTHLAFHRRGVLKVYNAKHHRHNGVHEAMSVMEY